MNIALQIQHVLSFPSLRAAFEQRGSSDPVKWLRGQTSESGAGRGRVFAARFLLHLWGHEPSIDIRAAWGAWDEDHRVAALRCLLAEEAQTIAVRAVIEHPHSILDARHSITLDGEDAVVSESWHESDGSEKKRYETRLPFPQLVHLALNTTPGERDAIDARADWRGVTAESPPRQDG